jgi:hypothetical protein
MRTNRTLFLICLIVIIGSGCTSSAPGTGTPGSPGCGDGVCSSLEDAQLCPEDCSPVSLSGKSLTTYLLSENGSEIAVLITYPDQPRFPDGAGVVVVVPPVFAAVDGFTTTPDFPSIGLIQVTFLWPGKSDTRFGVRSEGDYDYGGDASNQALRDVLRFAAGRFQNFAGLSITTLTPLTAMVDEVGIYAFDDAGIAAVNVLSQYGDILDGVEYFVGHENPTVDTLTCLEAGYHSEIGLLVLNPFYTYPSDYGPKGLEISYGTLRWDELYTDGTSSFPGRPYLDLNGNDQYDESDHIFGGQVPEMFGKRYYSAKLTQALLDNGALSLDLWPASLATPQEAATAWASRQSPPRYIDLALKRPDLKVMLLFARSDHAQVAVDKPHIHQAFQGFRFDAYLRWVRLNPDRSYLQRMTGSAGRDFPDNPANTQPEDWLEIGEYAFSGSGLTGDVAPLAALAEMSDRAHTGRWDDNLGTTLYEYQTPTPQP